MSILTPTRNVYVLSSFSVVGKKEFEGPLGSRFDYSDISDLFEQDTYEKAESEMQKTAVTGAISKSGLSENEISVLFSGDLTNQCVSSNYGSENFSIPFLGIYGACSTCAEGLIFSALSVGFGAVNNAVCATSSHNCTAERQFRYPLEYGSQHTPTSQWTVTGSAAYVVSSECRGQMLPKIAHCLIGKTADYGIHDINNMGAAMAPAAVDTLNRYFKESGLAPENFDIILTGDLGFEGHRIVSEMMTKNGFNMDNYNDCGLMIYDLEKQDVHAGGSGCGCSAVVLASYIYPKLCSGEYKNVLFLGTGALMSPTSVQQGLSIPGIAHLVHLKGAC